MERSFQLLLLFSLFTCKFNLSPYTADTPSLKLNQANLARIEREDNEIGSDFKVALISDTHNYYKELDELIKTINAKGPYSFVIVSGDITIHGLREEFDVARRFFNKLHFPYLVVIGNHDHLVNGAKIFGRMFGETDFAFDYKDVSFVFYDNNNWETASAVPNTNRVREALERSTAGFKVLVGHIFPGDTERFSPTMIDQWISMIEDNQVNYVINGHNHNPAEGSFGGAVQLTVGSPSKRSYFELIITAGGITHQKISF